MHNRTTGIIKLKKWITEETSNAALPAAGTSDFLILTLTGQNTKWQKKKAYIPNTFKQCTLLNNNSCEVV
jgi:hypothetical protein